MLLSSVYNISFLIVGSFFGFHCDACMCDTEFFVVEVPLVLLAALSCTSVVKYKTNITFYISTYLMWKENSNFLGYLG